MRKPRNRFKDVLWDYYKTNREYSKENADQNKKNGDKKTWSSSEKTFLVVIIIGLIGLGIKYLIF